MSGAGQYVNDMDNGKVWIFQNGSNADGAIGDYKEGQDVKVSTKPNDEIYRTIIRGCSNFNELLELYLYVNTSTPKPDFFATKIKRYHTLDYNKRA